MRKEERRRGKRYCFSSGMGEENEEVKNKNPVREKETRNVTGLLGSVGEESCF